MPEHFYRSQRSACWYVRLVAPDNIRHLVPQADYRKSTGQRDLRKAKTVGMALLAEKRREWQDLTRLVASGGGDDVGCYAQPTTLTGPVIEKICAARLYASMHVDEVERTEGLSTNDLAEIEQFCSLTERTMRSVLAQGKASHDWPRLVQDLLQWSETCGHILDADDPMFAKLVRDFAAVEKEAAARIQARNLGDMAVTPAVPSYRSPALSSLVEMFREFKAQRSQRPHVDACIHAWSLLIDHCGDLPFDAVTPTHVYNFLHDRMRAAQKPWSERRALGFGKAALREAFGLARTRGLMTAPNPVDAMEVDPRLTDAEEAKHLKPRYPFTALQLNKLFASGWYDRTNTRGRRQLSWPPGDNYLGRWGRGSFGVSC